MFQTRLKLAAEAVQAHLDQELSQLTDRPLLDAMRYAVQGGKRFRAFLVIEGARLHEVDPKLAIHPAAAVEAMHAYSLVHDDLPAMDNDSLRRGQPTVHVKWDEATAILVGDALQAFAYELLTSSEVENLKSTFLLVKTLATATGISGMVLGQALDIAAEASDQPLTLQQVRDLQAGKTGALIGWAAAAGPRLALADTAPVETYGSLIGEAFQIADDLLDVEGDSVKTGKRLGKDAEAGKATFVSLLGLKEAKTRAKELVEEAESALEIYGVQAEALRRAARFAISRDR